MFQPLLAKLKNLIFEHYTIYAQQQDSILDYAKLFYKEGHDRLLAYPWIKTKIRYNKNIYCSDKLLKIHVV